MARLQVTFENSDTYTSGPLSMDRAETCLHLVYVKALKTNMGKVKKYTGDPASQPKPPKAKKNRPDKKKLPKYPKIPAKYGLLDFGTKEDRSAQLKNLTDGNLITAAII